MIQRSSLLYLDDAIKEFRFLETVAKSTTFDQFTADSLVFRATAYSIQTLSEAVRHFPQEWLDEHPTVQWPEIRALGNRTRHGYFGLDLRILWKIVVQEAPDLKPVLEQIVSSNQA